MQNNPLNNNFETEIHFSHKGVKSYFQVVGTLTECMSFMVDIYTLDGSNFTDG